MQLGTGYTDWMSWSLTTCALSAAVRRILVPWHHDVSLQQEKPSPTQTHNSVAFPWWTQAHQHSGHCTAVHTSLALQSTVVTVCTNQLWQRTLYTICGNGGRRCSSVGIVTTPRAGRTGGGVQIATWARNFLASQTSGSSLGPTQAAVWWPPGASFPGSKTDGHQADHSSQFIAEVKNEWGWTYTSPICLHGVRKENFAISLYTL